MGGNLFYDGSQIVQVGNDVPSSLKEPVTQSFNTLQDLENYFIWRQTNDDHGYDIPESPYSGPNDLAEYMGNRRYTDPNDPLFYARNEREALEAVKRDGVDENGRLKRPVNVITTDPVPSTFNPMGEETVEIKMKDGVQNLLNRFHTAVPDKHVREAILEPLYYGYNVETLEPSPENDTPNDRLSRFLDVYDYAKRPNIINSPLTPVYDTLGNPNDLSSRAQTFRDGTIFIPRSDWMNKYLMGDDILAELPHSIDINRFKFVSHHNTLPDLPVVTDDTVYPSGYNTPGHYEYKAHTIIEPIIRDYIYQSNSERDITSPFFKAPYTHYSTPKSIEEVDQYIRKITGDAYKYALKHDINSNRDLSKGP